MESKGGCQRSDQANRDKAEDFVDKSNTDSQKNKSTDHKAYCDQCRNPVLILNSKVGYDVIVSCESNFIDQLLILNS